MPGDPNFTTGAIIAYNGDSERGWNDPPTLSFNSNSAHINSNRRGKLDLRKRIAHDQAMAGTGQVVQPSSFPPKGTSNDLSKGVANLGITDPRQFNNQSPLQNPVHANGHTPVQSQSPSFYNPLHQCSTTTTPSLPLYPIPSTQTQEHPMHAASMSVIPQVPSYEATSTAANNENLLPNHANFHRSVSEPNFAHPFHLVSDNGFNIADISTSPPGIRSKADLVNESDLGAAHIGQPLVKTYSPLMITPLVQIPSRQSTPSVIQPVPITKQPVLSTDNGTPFNSPQDQHHDYIRRSSSPGLQPHLLTGLPCHSSCTPPPPPCTQALSRSEGSSPRSSSPKTNIVFEDDGKTSEERRDATMGILIQVLELHRESLKKSADDISKKMEVMKQKWSSGKLSETAQRRLYKLATALQEHNHDEAHKVHLSIIVDHVSEVNQFMVAIKKLIGVSSSSTNAPVL